MTTLVIHAGTPLTGADRVREQLVAAREPLGRAGVALVGKDGAKAWDRAVRQVLGGESPPVLKRIVRQPPVSEPPTLLLSSELAAAALASSSNVQALRGFSRDHGLDTRVVLVVREQLEMLNAWYCREVMALRTSIGFDAFVAETMASTVLDLGGRFDALLDDTDIHVAAVPFDRLDATLPAAGVLAAARIPGEDAIAEPGSAPVSGPGAGKQTLPGPVLLTATRLLHKRLTRLGVIRRSPVAELLAAAAPLRERAVTADWDDRLFWGWSAERAEATAKQFAAGNASFAARAWGTPWPDEPPSRQQTRQDLAAAPPAVVSDAMTMIHRVVDELTTAPPFAPEIGASS